MQKNAVSQLETGTVTFLRLLHFTITTISIIRVIWSLPTVCKQKPVTYIPDCDQLIQTTLLIHMLLAVETADQRNIPSSHLQSYNSMFSSVPQSSMLQKAHPLWLCVLMHSTCKILPAGPFQSQSVQLLAQHWVSTFSRVCTCIVQCRVGWDCSQSYMHWR